MRIGGKSHWRRAMCAILFVVTVASLVSGQTQNRVIEVYEGGKAQETTALQILEMRVNGNPVSINQPFAADDDWLSRLTLKVRNVSDRTINVLPLTFGLSELNPGPKGDKDIVFTILRGLYGDGSETREANDERKAIPPGQEMEVSFTEKQLCIIKEMAAIKGVKPTRIKLVPYTFVTYEDGTRVRTGVSFPKS